MGRLPEPGDEALLAGPSRNFQVFDPLDFLAEVTQHIPDPGEHLIRYYGWYSNLPAPRLRQAGKTRGQRAHWRGPASVVKRGGSTPLWYVHATVVKPRYLLNVPLPDRWPSSTERQRYGARDCRTTRYEPGHTRRLLPVGAAIEPRLCTGNYRLALAAASHCMETVQEGVGDNFWGEVPETSEVPWIAASFAQTWNAWHVQLQHPMHRAKGSRARRVRRSEHGQDRFAERGDNVHGAGIVPYE